MFIVFNLVLPAYMCLMAGTWDAWTRFDMLTGSKEVMVIISKMLLFIDHLLCIRHYAECFTYTSSFKPPRGKYAFIQQILIECLLCALLGLKNRAVSDVYGSWKSRDAKKEAKYIAC